ncbi:hypothetical protein D3C80_2216590 [compost metagenome]
MFLIKFWRGVTVVAKDAEVLRTGTFAHDQNGQGFTTMGLPVRIQLSVFTDFDKRLLR